MSCGRAAHLHLAVCRAPSGRLFHAGMKIIGVPRSDPGAMAGLVQADVTGLELAGEQTPQINKEQAHTGGDRLLPSRSSGFAFGAKDGGELHEASPLWLELAQSPHQLGHERSQVGIATAVDLAALLLHSAAAVYTRQDTPQ